MDKLDISPGKADDSLVPRPHRLVRRLAWLYAVLALTVGLLLCAVALPEAWLPRMRSLAHEILNGGLAATVLTALLLALAALCATLALTAARSRYAAAPAASRASERRPWSLADPGFAARQAQALILPAGALAIWLLTRLLWPRTHGSVDPVAGNIAGAFVLGIAFVSLVAERVMNAFPAPQLPEAPMLRRMLLLVTVLLAAAGCLQFARDADQAWSYWLQLVLLWVPSIAVLELALRALARLFLPPPQASAARAVVDSLVVGVLTGGPRAPGVLLRTHFGLDFARSWALSFLGAALLPALIGTALLCWALSGLKLIDLSHRGIYERFGAPVAVLGPGLHLLMPWPMGRLRTVEYGAIHSVPIGIDPGVQGNEAAPEAQVGAEATPPVTLNRLWESAHADQAHYLVASPGTGEQGFQSVSTEIYVLYRVGLSDNAALESTYAVSDPESLIREAASALVLRYFNSRTLEEVLYAQRENVAGNLRSALAEQINAYHAGLDIVSVLIEEIHPPAGAAEAYHAVQAAQINANASIANERGRAQRTAGVAQQEAHQLVASATGQAEETRDAATADAYRFQADDRAYQKSGKSFLLERLYSDLAGALRSKPLTIMDHRLNANNGPIIDMRPQGVAPAVSSAGAPGAAAAAPPVEPAEEPAFSTAD